MRRGWIRRIVIVAIAVLGAFLLHPFIFRWMADQLIASTSDYEVDCVAVLDGDERFRVVQEMHEKSPDLHVLVFQEPHDRLTQWNVTPPTSQRDLAALREAGVPEEQIEILPFSSYAEWEWARQLHQWTAQNPDRSVAVLCREFDSRRTRYTVDKTASDASSTVTIIPLSDRRYDRTNWWKSRTGVKSFWSGGFDLIYALLFGEENPPAPDWNPDDYEKQLGP